MIKTNKSMLRILSLLVLVALMIASLPAVALADAGFSAAVKAKSMKIYADAYGQQYIGSLPQKTIVTVEKYVGGVAKINYNGRTGFARVSDMLTVESFAKEASVTKDTRVYQQASTSSPSTKVKAGTKVNVLTEKNGIAMIEKGGKVGYMSAAHLAYDSFNVPALKPETGTDSTISGSEVVDKLPDQVVDALPDSVVDTLEKGEYTSSQLEALKEALEAEYKKQQETSKKEESTSTESIQDAFTSGKYSNEQLCFLFATKVMGYNAAAATGLLANIKAESNFKVNANGDSGQSYGICQWYSSRKTRLLNWCANNGLESSTLIAQLYFLKYELETYYPSVNKYMKGVENSEQGAYDAAYYFCYHFEAPANKASKSVSRGNSAKNTYFPKYAA